MMGMPQNWRPALIWVLRVNFIFLAIDLLLLLFLSMFLKVTIFMLVEDGFFSLILLLNSGIIFLMGGIVAMSSSIFPSKVREHILHSDEKWSQEKHKKSEQKANLYILAGIFLFLESLVSGFIL